jgi:hypothetical protein
MNDELDFDAVLLKKVTDAYAAKFPVLSGQGCNEIVDEVVRLIEASCTDTNWTPAASLPDADTTVLLALSDGEVWQGYLDGETWRDTSAMPIASARVTHWMHTPAHPVPEAAAAPMRTSTGLRCASCWAKDGEAHAVDCPERKASTIESWHTGLPAPADPACVICNDTGTSFGKACTCGAAKGGAQ